MDMITVHRAFQDDSLILSVSSIFLNLGCFISKNNKIIPKPENYSEKCKKKPHLKTVYLHQPPS